MMNVSTTYGYKKENKRSSHISEEQRNTFIKEHASLVKSIAHRIAMRIPSNISVDDLISYGTMGLLDAISKFDPSKNVKFKTYAEVRIRGSILDGLRSQDWIPRSVRKKIQVIENAILSVERKLGRPADDMEIAEEMGVDLDSYYKYLNQAKSVDLFSLNEYVKNRDSFDSKESYESFIPGSFNPLDYTMFSELKEVIAKAIKQLSKKEQTVVALYYNEELTLKEIGKVLELTESRICQIHTQIIIRLRTKLSPYLSD
ncbi:RNA polymerase sigma factor for flagellar operon FliA [Candidatus Magnetomoraceae bacterium gMMP-15]